MDSPLRKIFDWKASIWPLKSPGPSAPDGGLQTIAYESTSQGSKVPIFISQPLRRSMTEQRSRDDLEGLAIRAFSYESAHPGKAPVMGGRPHRGNGPVKLQTSRRLSSGELLVTSQDHQRTLEDILEGDYIVGGIEKRTSKSPRIRSPTPSLSGPFSVSQQNLRPFGSPHLSTCSSWPSHGRSVSAIHGSERVPFHTKATRSFQSLHFEPKSPQVSARDRLADSSEMIYGLAISTNHTDVGGRLHNATQLENIKKSQIPTLDSRNPTEARLASGEDKDSDQACLPICNATLRISSSYSQTPRVDFDRLAISPAASHGLRCEDSSQASHPASSESDEASDSSSNRRDSILCSEASSTAYTARTSIHEDVSNTREEVHRLVDHLRSNYLKAIEEKTGEISAVAPQPTLRKTSAPSKNVRKRKSSAASKSKGSQRQSWHSSEVTSPDATNTQRWTADTNDVCEISDETEHLEGEADPQVSSESTLQRADSMTLGSMLAPCLAPRQREEP